MIDPFKIKRRSDPLPKPTPVLDERNDPTTPTATLQIYSFIDAYLGRKEQDTHVNRASAASMCHLRRWFQGHGYPGEALTPRVIVNFTLGDLTEHTVKYFIAQGCVGPGKLYSHVDFGKVIGQFTIQNGKEITLYDQEDLTAQIGELTVTAHVDGWGKRNSDGLWELIEVKSAADYGYDRFKEEGPGEYLKQAVVNLQTGRAKELGAVGVRFFYLKKNTGHMWDRYFPYDAELALEVAEEYRLAAGDERPRAPYHLTEETFRTKPTGRIVAKYPCSYCPYLAECKGPHEIEFKGNTPVYVFKKQKESA